MTDATTVSGLGLMGSTDALLDRDRKAARDRERDEAPQRREEELRRSFFASNPGRVESEWDAVREDVIRADTVARTKEADRRARESQASIYRNAL